MDREGRGFRLGQTLARSMAMLLTLIMVWPAPVAALGLPGRRHADTAERAAGPRRQGALHEVAPPLVVQDLRQALADHDPRVRIIAPANDSLLPAGPWSLRLEVEDWPLVDAGPLGLGPHLVAQLDDLPAIPLSGTEAEMPPLSPGSHRLTVFAARPWGEAVKSPGAYRQIRLHRLAANSLTVPAPGSPQLIPVRPTPQPVQEPVLLDWLLLDAPLQRLRGEGTEGWRLRVSVNGDSFLVDQQTPLWLSGWRRGENALQLELVDGRGEPINPPFNAMVSAVTVSGDLPQARWLGPTLDPEERSRLLGEAQPEPPLPQSPPPRERSAAEPDPWELSPAIPAPVPGMPASPRLEDDHEVEQQPVGREWERNVDLQDAEEQDVDKRQTIDQERDLPKDGEEEVAAADPDPEPAQAIAAGDPDAAEPPAGSGGGESAVDPDDTLMNASDQAPQVRLNERQDR